MNSCVEQRHPYEMTPLQRARAILNGAHDLTTSGLPDAERRAPFLGRLIPSDAPMPTAFPPSSQGTHPSSGGPMQPPPATTSNGVNAHSPSHISVAFHEPTDHSLCKHGTSSRWPRRISGAFADRGSAAKDRACHRPASHRGSLSAFAAAGTLCAGESGTLLELRTGRSEPARCVHPVRWRAGPSCAGVRAWWCLHRR